MEKMRFESPKPLKDLTLVEAASGEKLLYAQEFKDFVAEHPGYLSYTAKVIDSMEEDNTQKMEVRKIPINVERQFLGGNNPTFKVTLRESGEELFVKTADINGGESTDYLLDPTREILTMEYAAKVLKEFDWLKIPDYQCAYIGKNRKTYYVAKWNTTAAVSLEYLSFGNAEKNSDELMKNAQDKLRVVMEKLSPLGFFDIRPGNVAYDPDTGDLFIFDLRLNGDISPQEKLRE